MNSLAFHYTRRLLGDVSCYEIVLPLSLEPQLIERLERRFPESRLYANVWKSHGPSQQYRDPQQFRDSLYRPAAERMPNVGTIFKTGLIEK